MNCMACLTITLLELFLINFGMFTKLYVLLISMTFKTKGQPFLSQEVALFLPVVSIMRIVAGCTPHQLFLIKRKVCFFLYFLPCWMSYKTNILNCLLSYFHASIMAGQAKHISFLLDIYKRCIFVGFLWNFPCPKG